MKAMELAVFQQGQISKVPLIARTRFVEHPCVE
jgi:hypothetical protein